MKLLIATLIAATGFLFTTVPFAQNNTCAANCLERDYKGQCTQPGPDYCGPDARCVKNCEVRAFNEQCSKYKPDFCGPNATCKPRCVDSYNGYCNRWGEDTCYTR